MACSCPATITDPNGNVTNGGDPSTNIVGTQSNDVLTGTDGGDVINALAGDDVIQAGGGDDLINGGTGDDFVDGGEGADTVTYPEPGIFTITPTNLGGDSNGYRFESSVHGVDILLNIENIQLSERDDVLNGYVSGVSNIHVAAGAGNDVLLFADGGVILNSNAHSGFETINGGSGADFIFGTDADETIIGGAENDTIHGGGGMDLVSYSQPGSFTVTGNSSSGFTVGSPQEGNDTLMAIETIRLSEMDDTVGSGIAAGLTVDGGDGSNTVQLPDGGVIFDFSTVMNYQNFSIIRGGSGNDTIIGSSNAETITGGEGVDTIHAGGGDDTIVFVDSNESINGGEGMDRLEFVRQPEPIFDNLLINLSENDETISAISTTLSANTAGYYENIGNAPGAVARFFISNIEEFVTFTNLNSAHFIGSDEPEIFHAFVPPSYFWGMGGDDIYVLGNFDFNDTQQTMNIIEFSNTIGNNDKLDFSYYFPLATLDTNMSLTHVADRLVIHYVNSSRLENHSLGFQDIFTSGGLLEGYLSSNTNSGISEAFANQLRSDWKNGSNGLTGDKACSMFFIFADMSECP